MYDGVSVGKNAGSEVDFQYGICGWQEDVGNFSNNDARSKFFIFIAFIDMTIM